MSRGGTIWIMCIAWALAVQWMETTGMQSRCLPEGQHKASSSPEGQLGVCQLYADNACCSPQVVQDLSKASDIYWSRCGNLSSRCEEHLQQLECFYRCSPMAAQWPHPQRPTAVLAVPLCQSFCDRWYDACKEDLTCAHNWFTDWYWGPHGNNCSRDCISYGQMYRDGKELCETIWDDSFIVSPDPCVCLTLTVSDTVFSTSSSRTEDSDSSEEVDITKHHSNRDGRIDLMGPCTGLPLLQKLSRNRQKRLILVEDGEGSGSGF